MSSNKLTAALQAKRDAAFEAETAASKRLMAAVDAMNQLKTSIEQDAECRIQLLVQPINNSPNDFKVSRRTRPNDSIIEYELQHRDARIKETAWKNGSGEADYLFPDEDLLSRFADFLLKSNIVPPKR